MVWYLYLSEPPHSHLDMVCALTFSASAACSWVSFFATRNPLRFSDSRSM